VGLFSGPYKLPAIFLVWSFLRISTTVQGCLKNDDRSSVAGPEAMALAGNLLSQLRDGQHGLAVTLR